MRCCFDATGNGTRNEKTAVIDFDIGVCTQVRVHVNVVAYTIGALQQIQLAPFMCAEKGLRRSLGRSLGRGKRERGGRKRGGGGRRGEGSISIHQHIYNSSSIAEDFSISVTRPFT